MREMVSGGVNLPWNLAVSMLIGACLVFTRLTLGAALLVTPFVYDTSGAQVFVSIACGLALIALALPRGAVRGRYAGWNRYIVRK